LIDEIVCLAGDVKPIALIGVGGIGKTSIALKVLHHDRIKQRFGDERRFIRCDQFPSSCSHLLSRLSKAIGAGVENPEGLAYLRPFLSSKKMLIVLDNAESILDPEGANAGEIYAVVEELSQFDNICLCVTSRISTIPSACKTLDIPTLSIAAARDVFHCIYEDVEQPDLLDNILCQLDFHPLSITLLATVAHQNKWNTDRLAKEWEGQRTRMLQTMHNRSLAATIELSLSSPMFQELGPDARGLLGVVAFFPQGVDEKNLDWLFSTFSNRTNIFDKFCILSLAYRNNSFVTMLAPLRDHLCPKDPLSSPLLRMTKERYFTRMSVNIDPNDPGFQESRWITSEDVNVEHLLDVFTTIDANSDSTWDACADFVDHLTWHKNRLTILGSKIEGLPDDHWAKPNCLYVLSRLFRVVGNRMERKRLLIHTLRLWRERGDDRAVARTLRVLSEANQRMGLHDEGIRQAEEASQIFKGLGDSMGETLCLKALAMLLKSNKQPDAAEEAASRAIDLFSKKGKFFQVSSSRRLLGHICESKGEIEKAIEHFKAALGTAASFTWTDQLFWVHRDLADLFLKKDNFEDAQVHIEHAKSHSVKHTYHLGRAMQLQARLWYKQNKLGEARSEALRAADLFEKFGAVENLKYCRELIQRIEGDMDKPVVLNNSVDSGEPLFRSDATSHAYYCFTSRAGHWTLMMTSFTSLPIFQEHFLHMSISHRTPRH